MDSGAGVGSHFSGMLISPMSTMYVEALPAQLGVNPTTVPVHRLKLGVITERSATMLNTPHASEGTARPHQH